MPLVNKYHLLLLWGISFGGILSAQDKSNKGKEFWLGYGHNVLFTQASPPNSQNHILYLSAEQAATVTVSVNNTSWSKTVSVPANSVDVSVVIPKTGPEDARILTEGISTKGIHIVSDVPIVVYSHQQGAVSSGATMLMPVETFGYTYYSLNFTQISNYSDSYSWFYVVAAENNTRLLINPSDSTEGGWLPNQTNTINLNKGELYNVFGKRTGAYTGKDMTGSKIISVTGADGNCHPVAVFSGSSRNIICSTGNGGEVMQQQIFPANAWGTRYVTYHTVMNPNGDISSPFLNYYRVAVRNPNTIVKKNGVLLTGLINNFYYEFTSNSGDYIESDQPVLVAQYAISTNECSGIIDPPIGDPEMMYLSPVEQGVKNAFFYTTRNQAIDLNFINVIIPQGGLSSLFIDGTPPSSSEYFTHPANADYAVVVRRFMGAAAQHTIKSDSSFIASVYGAGFYESYGYNMGTLVNNLNAYGNIKNTLNANGKTDTFTCTKTPFRITANLAYRASSIHWQLRQLQGLTPNADSIISNPVPVDSSFINGRKYYTYTLQQDFYFTTAGTYFIPVIYTARDIDACNQTESTAIKVVVKQGPTADFNFNNPACLADSIRFKSAAAGAFTIINYNWFFEDNSSSNTINTTKLFATLGNQNVRYRIYADNGCIGDTSITITINETPVASFTLSGAPFCTGKPVTLTAAATGISTWNWDLGNTSRTTVPPFTHSYNVDSTYTVKLVVKNAAGCISDTTEENITINPTPVVYAGADTTIKVGTTVTTNASITPAGNYNFTWSPSLYLNQSTILNPVFKPDITTTYTLSAINKLSNCAATGGVVITVVSALYIPNAFTPNNDGKNDNWIIPGLALYPEARVSVFNRAGQVIYNTRGYTANPWNGTCKGIDQPNDVYVYLIQLNDDSGQVLKGTITIIR